MSYVIQNFQYFETFTTRTPRFKFFFFYTNLYQIIFFFNEIAFLITLGFNNVAFLPYRLHFYKFFFTKQFKKIFQKIHFRFIGFYDNKLIRSLAFWFCKISFLSFNQSFLKKKIIQLGRPLKKNPALVKNFLFNQYLITFLLLNFRFFKQYYKNLFFCIMILNVNYWFDINNFFNFFYNFIIINRADFKNYPFYSNYFLNVYSF